MHPNYAETRRLFETHTLAALAQQHTPEEMKVVEPLIKEYIANTVTDEFLFQDFQRIAAEKRAKEAQAAADLAAADQAKKAAEKVARAHSAKLASANKVAMTYQERAEAAEWKLRSMASCGVNGRERRELTLKGELMPSPQRPQPLAEIVCLHEGRDRRKCGECKQDDQDSRPQR